MILDRRDLIQRALELFEAPADSQGTGEAIEEWIAEAKLELKDKTEVEETLNELEEENIRLQYELGRAYADLGELKTVMGILLQRRKNREIRVSKKFIDDKMDLLKKLHVENTARGGVLIRGEWSSGYRFGKLRQRARGGAR